MGRLCRLISATAMPKVSPPLRPCSMPSQAAKYRSRAACSTTRARWCTRACDITWSVLTKRRCRLGYCATSRGIVLRTKGMSKVSLAPWRQSSKSWGPTPNSRRRLSPAGPMSAVALPYDTTTGYGTAGDMGQWVARCAIATLMAARLVPWRSFIPKIPSDANGTRRACSAAAGGSWTVSAFWVYSRWQRSRWTRSARPGPAYCSYATGYRRNGPNSRSKRLRTSGQQVPLYPQSATSHTTSCPSTCFR
mmetsp:Transcript_8327/g.16116  ORF Transcript_8327/g.16116 Transcript_8327/m.16116 type:complete len:249 (-) Transcript_8327:466-1212(-)